MNKKEFEILNIDEKVKYLNKKLLQGQTVMKIRKDLGISEKLLQKQIKQGGYKYNSRIRQYVKDTEMTVVNNTNVVVNDNYKYLEQNIDILKDMIEKYKITRATTTSTTSIIIDLISDKHLNAKPHSLRVNEFVWEDWQKFCEDNKYYSKQDLLSMALKLYMEQHKK